MIYYAQRLLKGRVRAQVVDAQQRVHQDTGWQNNLILNQGMDGIAVRYIADNFTHCCIGTGTTPTVLDSGVSQIAQSNVTVTITGGSFVFTNTATDAGKVIKWDAGNEATIVAVLTPTTATVSNSTTVAAGEFRVFQTRQTGLDTEVRRTNTYYTVNGACTTTLAAPNTVVMKRTFNFPLESPLPVTYTEVGLSDTGTIGNNLFSRILLNTPILVAAGLRARVFYELTIVLSPSSSTVKVASITGWPIAPAVNTNATESLEDWGLAGVASSGVTAAIRTVSGVPIVANEPSALCDVLISSDTQALGSPGDPVLNRWHAGDGTVTFNLDAYTSGNYARTKSCEVPTSSGNMTNLRVIAMGHVISGSDFLPVSTLLFDETQTKTGSFLLDVTFRITWGRVLT